MSDDDNITAVSDDKAGVFVSSSSISILGVTGVHSQHSQPYLFFFTCECGDECAHADEVSEAQ